MQTVPVVAALGPGLTGLAIGYRVLTIGGSEHAAFTTAGVVESDVDGTYYVTGGVAVPDEGAYVVFGVPGTDYLVVSVESVTAVLGGMATLSEAMTAMGATLVEELKKWLKWLR